MDSLANYFKQFYDSPSHQQFLKQQEEERISQISLREKEVEHKERAIEKETEYQDREKEKGLDRIEKQAEKEKDKRFSTAQLILGIIITVLLTKLVDYFFK